MAEGQEEAEGGNSGGGGEGGGAGGAAGGDPSGSDPESDGGDDGNADRRWRRFFKKRMDEVEKEMVRRDKEWERRLDFLISMQGPGTTAPTRAREPKAPPCNGPTWLYKHTEYH